MPADVAAAAAAVIVFDFRTKPNTNEQIKNNTKFSCINGVYFAPIRAMSKPCNDGTAEAE